MKNINNLQKRINSLGPENGADYYITPFTTNPDDAREAVDVIQSAWSNGQSTAENPVKHFAPDFNDPNTVIKIGEKIEEFCQSKNPQDEFANLNNLSFALKTREADGNYRVASTINLQFNHDNESVEWGRLATHKDFGNRGFSKVLFNLVTELNENNLQYQMWSDSNTMHPITQLLNKKIDAHATGFNPLKYLIDNHIHFKNETDREGNLTYDLIYWGGRVSTTFNPHLLNSHIANRNEKAYIIGEVESLQKEVLNSFELKSINHNHVEGEIPLGSIFEGGNFVEDDICKWMKINNPFEYSVNSIIEYAQTKGKKYIEVDVPASRGTTKLQKELVENGFFVGGYMPAYQSNGKRTDVVRFCYLTDKEQAKEYCNTFSENEKKLGTILIPKNMGVGNIVLRNLELSLMK